jgi:ATP-dependent helicase/DNAse subunit B
MKWREDLDARVLGNFLHEVMELFYRQLQDKKQSNVVVATDFTNGEAIIDDLIDRVFIEAYHLEPGKPVEYEGQRLVVREIVRRFAHRHFGNGQSIRPVRNRSIGTRGLEYSVTIDQYPGSTLLGGKN